MKKGNNAGQKRDEKRRQGCHMWSWCMHVMGWRGALASGGKQERWSRGRNELAGAQEGRCNGLRDDWEINSFRYQGEEFGLNC